VDKASKCRNQSHMFIFNSILNLISMKKKEKN